MRIVAATAAVFIGGACSLQACFLNPLSSDVVAVPEPSETLPAKFNTSNLNGSVVDLDTLQPLKHPYVSITDVFGRTLELYADDAGIFRFENVPPGTATITISAPGYLKSVTALDIEPMTEIEHRFPLRSETQ